MRVEEFYCYRGRGEHDCTPAECGRRQRDLGFEEGLRRAFRGEAASGPDHPEPEGKSRATDRLHLALAPPLGRVWEAPRGCNTAMAPLGHFFAFGNVVIVQFGEDVIRLPTIGLASSGGRISSRQTASPPAARQCRSGQSWTWSDNRGLVLLAIGINPPPRSVKSWIKRTPSSAPSAGKFLLVRRRLKNANPVLICYRA